MGLTLTIDNMETLPDGGPLTFRSELADFDIGRNATCAWTLPDNSRVISGRHCQITYADGAYHLYDLSTNGTFIAGAKQRINSPLRLQNGDRLQIGQYFIAIAIDQPRAAGSADISPAPAPAPAPSPAPAPAPGQNIWDVGGGALPPENVTPIGAAPPPVDFGAAFVPVGQVNDPNPQPGPQPGPPAGNGTDVIARILRAAGAPPDLAASRPQGELADDIGHILGTVIARLCQILSARRETDKFLARGQRTEFSLDGNNPLKFNTGPDKALEMILGQRTEGFLDGPDAITEAFDNITTHQFALFAAIQPALKNLLEDMSPESVEEKASGAMLGMGMGVSKAKAWEIFVERWDAKIRPHENGMLDVFLLFYAEEFERIRKSGGR